MFFLMCSERSGSNFITKLFNGHNNICGPSTKHVVNPVARNVFRYGDLADEGNWRALLVDIHRLLNVDFAVWKTNFSLEGLFSLAAIGDIASLIQNIFLEEARANGKQHVFVKENQIYEFMPFLLLNFPMSKYIYMSRDPRDMALSWKKSLVHFGGVVRAAKQWQHDQQNTLKNYDELQKIWKAYFVRYEDLTSEPEKYVRDMLLFLGLPYDENVLDFHEDELTKKNAGKMAAWRNLSQGVISGNTKKYIKELSEEEIKAIEKICYFEMKHLGYEPEFSREELNAFGDGNIDQLERKEFLEIRCERSIGVRANMEAKKVFYQKIMGS